MSFLFSKEFLHTSLRLTFCYHARHEILFNYCFRDLFFQCLYISAFLNQDVGGIVTCPPGFLFTIPELKARCSNQKVKLEMRSGLEVLDHTTNRIWAIRLAVYHQRFPYRIFSSKIFC